MAAFFILLLFEGFAFLLSVATMIYIFSLLHLALKKHLSQALETPQTRARAPEWSHLLSHLLVPSNAAAW